jgi:HD-like signal output (HDOD) protein
MLKTEPADINITDLFTGDLQLTSPPALFFELKRVLDDPNKSLAEAGDVILNDPSLTMRLLKMVNSAYFGFSNRIATVSHAVSIIGSKELQNLVLATLIIEKFSSQQGGMMSMHDFWAMSMRSALMAKELALHCKVRFDKESIFVCGLLHDIGKLVFYRQIPDLAHKIELYVEQTGETEVNIEQEILGFNRYDVGSELARLWNLPEVISETIVQHCHIDNSSPYGFIADLVRTANLLSKMEFSHEATDLGKWGISDDELCVIVDKVHDQFEEVFAVFYPSL